jgi:rubrerythrin
MNADERRSDGEDRPDVADLVSSGRCRGCGGTGYPNPESCPVCADEWQAAAERCRELHGAD